MQRLAEHMDGQLHSLGELIDAREQGLRTIPEARFQSAAALAAHAARGMNVPKGPGVLAGDVHGLEA